MNITIYAEASFTNTLAKKGLQELLTKIHLNMLDTWFLMKEQ